MDERPRRMPRLTRATDPRVGACQTGMVLLVVLTVLVAMALGTLTLVRQVDSASLIAGNLAFQQAATQSADGGLEQATVWLHAQHMPAAPAGQTDLPLHLSSTFYRADGSQQGPNANTQVAWEQHWSQVLVPAHQFQMLPVNQAGQRVSFVIDRLCRWGGAPTPAHCAVGHQPKVPAEWVSPLPAVYYRITVRVDGPRDTLSMVQAVVAVIPTPPMTLRRVAWRELLAY